MHHRVNLLLGLALVALPAFSQVIPRPAPALTVDVPGGGKLDLARYKGKVIALEFLLTGCPHCQQCSRTLSKLIREYGPKGFQPVGAAINQDADSHLQEFIQQNGVNYPVGLSNQEAANTYLQHSMMVPMQMPQLVFIDRAGTIRAQYSGTSPFFADEERNMRTTIEELLKEPAAGGSTGHATATRKGKK